MFNRRNFVLTSLALAATPAFAGDNPFAALEALHGGRLGVAVLNTATGDSMSYRANERFPMCSTFKLLAVAAVLHKVDQGNERLDRWVPYGQKDLLDHAPVTRANVEKGGLPLHDLCEAAIEVGDNTAANLILASLGGPAAATAYARSIGDTVTRIDRTEPTANTCIPGDPRDTTTPSVMAANLNKLTQGGETLTSGSQDLLTEWLFNCQTAASRIPAGLPHGWKSGDKTGSGANGTANDVAILSYGNRAPIFVAAYYTGSKAPDAEIDGVLAEVGQIVSSRYS
jgi:beta-lactamase class A